MCYGPEERDALDDAEPLESLDKGSGCFWVTDVKRDDDHVRAAMGTSTGGRVELNFS